MLPEVNEYNFWEVGLLRDFFLRESPSLGEQQRPSIDATFHVDKTSV